MKDENAQALLAKVMGWGSDETMRYVPQLQLLADFKYDQYQRFGPGKRFVESLALWLNQFDAAERQQALDFVLDELVFFSEQEMTHLVQTAYADHIIHERIRLISEEKDIAPHCVGQIIQEFSFQRAAHSISLPRAQ